MVTITQTPIGIKVIDQSVSATITTDGDPGALVTLDGHSLVTGDYVYIESDIDEYNGMWYVVQGDYNHFRFSANAGGDLIPYYQDADITYYQTQTHGWSSIFLPIIYKATNDLWPVNDVDPAIGVVSQADDNGYTQLTLSGTTGAGALEYVILSDGTVHQVIEVGSSLLTINLPYDASNVITTAQKYYNNYQVRVKIFAGLPPSEPWADHKPWTEVAELSLTPDADNNVMFSVSDYIKALVNVRNNPLLFSLPLNLDAFTGFYISTAEAYDESDGYSITPYESAFTNNSFKGYAVAGVLPFKNLYSGHYSQYIYTSGTPAKWLNTLTTVIGIVDRYFDISFIKNIPGAFTLLIDKWANDYRYETEEVEYEDFGIGVYRLPLTFVSAYDQFCIRVRTPGVAGTPGTDPPPTPTLAALSAWTNGCGGAWGLGANPTTSVNGSGGVDGYITGAITDSAAGVSHNFTYAIDIGVTGSSTPTSVIRIALLDGACAVLDYLDFNYTSAGVKTETFSLTPATAATYIGIYITNNTPFDTKNYTVNSFVFNALEGEGSEGSEGTDDIPAADITEELCIDIYEVCGFDDAAVIQPTAARRLLEDGGFRLLED